MCFNFRLVSIRCECGYRWLTVMERRISERKLADVSVYISLPGQSAVRCAVSDISGMGIFVKINPLYLPKCREVKLVFALRMLGLFIVLPVFALEAARLPGGDDPARVGLAMGLYGLTQAFLQIPFGLASDRLGRKPTIVAGLLVFALGSAIAAWAPDLTWLAVGRAVSIA